MLGSEGPAAERLQTVANFATLEERGASVCVWYDCFTISRRARVMRGLQSKRVSEPGGSVLNEGVRNRPKHRSGTVRDGGLRARVGRRSPRFPANQLDS